MTRTISFVLIVFACALGDVPRANAGRSYDEQMSGLLRAMVQTFISGELFGLRPSNADASPKRPPCQQADYLFFLQQPRTPEVQDALRRQCKLVDIKKDGANIYAIASLPRGYCAAVKAAFEGMLETRVYNENAIGADLSFEHKGSKFFSSSRDLARGTWYVTACMPDDSLHITTPRTRRR